jgi:hypothetical protein
MEPSAILAVAIRRVTVLLLDLLVSLFFVFFPWLKNSRFEKRLDQLLSFDATRDLDERIRKIESARDNLRDALSAVDELQRSAQDNRAELAALQDALQRASAERDTLSAHNENLKRLADVDIRTIRRTLGIPTRQEVWRGHALSFVGGVLTTFILSLAYDFVVKPVFLHFFPYMGS